MKLSFLIIFFLILSGVTESAEQNTKSKEIRTYKHQESTKDVQTTADKEPDTPAPFQIQILEALRAIKDQIKSSSEQYDASQKSWNSPSVLIQIGLLVVGTFYTVFASLQWWAIRAGLRTDRPYLLIEKAEIFGIRGCDSMGGPTSDIAEYKSFNPYADFTFRNFGKGPALLNEAIIRLYTLKEIPKVDDFTDCKGVDIAQGAVGADSRWKLTTNDMRDVSGLFICEPDYEEFKKGTKTIFAWGRVQYKDVFQKPYRTVFCWELKQPQPVYYVVNQEPILTLDDFVRGPRTHNYAK